MAISRTGRRNNSSTKQINMYRAYGQHASMRRSCERICCQLILINGKKEETRCGPLASYHQAWKIICAKYASRAAGLILRGKSNRLLIRKCLAHCFKLGRRQRGSGGKFKKKKKKKGGMKETYFAASVSGEEEKKRQIKHF